MKHDEVGRYWNANADAWTQLARGGYDIYRDHLNTPAFLELLPDVNRLAGLDVGCGEGQGTRLLANRGARMMAIDISEKFIAHAREWEQQNPVGIEYHVASGVEMPFSADRFDFVTGFMSFMEMQETEQLLSEVHRVLVPGGFVQFSIPHPCFSTPHRKNLRDPLGRTFAIEVGNYFAQQFVEIEEWIFQSAPAEVKAKLPKFRIPKFSRSLSSWLNLLMNSGFRLDRVAEPCPSDETVLKYPAIQDAQVVSYFLHIRAIKL